MSLDPTKTLSLRKKAIAQIERRFKILKRLIIQSLIKGGVFASKGGILANAEPLDPPPFGYATDKERIEAFMAWLRKTIAEAVWDGVTEAERLWLNQIIEQAYVKGIAFSQSSIENVSPIATDGVVIQSFVQTTAQRLLVPMHLDRVSYIYTRTFTDLKNVTEVMASQMQTVLSDALFGGLGAKETAEKLLEKIEKIGVNRAKLIARTEIVNAYQQAVITEGELYTQVTGEEVFYKWQTAEDERVRSTHRARNNKIYTKKQVITLVGEPNCRCRVFLAFKKD